MKQLFKATRRIFGELFFVLSGIASVASLLIVIFSSKGYGPTIALIAVVLFLTAILIKSFQTLNRMTEQRYPNGYKNISTFASQRTEDGIHYEFELYKHIQSKEPFMSAYEHGFNWTGSKEPEVESDLQAVSKPISTDRDSYDKINLRFPKPLLYNQASAIHLRMLCNDSDDAAKPYISVRVKEPSQVIRWEIELRHKPKSFNAEARLMKKRMGSDLSEEYVLIDRIPFDKASMSYRHTIHDPKVGYFYKLEWEK